MTVDGLSELTGRAYAGEEKAQVMLGDVNLSGVRSASGLIRSNQDAMLWYRRAASQGFPLAQVRIGEIFYESRGADGNLVESQKWLELAVAQGLARARVNLAQAKMASGGKLSTRDAVDLLHQFTPAKTPRPGR